MSDVKHSEDGHGGCVTCHEYVWHTDDEFVRVPWPCPASRLPDYEAAVEALERLVSHVDWWNDTGKTLPIGLTVSAQEIREAREALARLRESVPA